MKYLWFLWEYILWSYADNLGYSKSYKKELHTENIRVGTKSADYYV